MKNQNFQEEAKHLEGVKKLMEDRIAFEEINPRRECF